MKIGRILWIKAAFCWVAGILRDRWWIPTLSSKCSHVSWFGLLHISITADVLNLTREQEVKQLNSMEIWSYHFLPWVTCCFFFSSLEYLGIEWMTKSFILETGNYYTSFHMNISLFFFQVVQEVYISSTWTLAGLH